ncbi:hypothetical protein PR048_004041 [Dryococelus australis]|uniref:Uncharacterized protein n=1 Tax=Dryococelus australis TaxID=614101 RepID=A0ABQ9I4C9_9NEOP|nr:hypothetical protein PR048_004041 [Dryococelus australis]
MEQSRNSRPRGKRETPEKITLTRGTVRHYSHVRKSKGNLTGNLNRATVAERLACSSATKANRVQYPAGPLPEFHRWESCWTMPLVGGSSRRSPIPPPPGNEFQRCSLTTSLHIHRISRPCCDNAYEERKGRMAYLGYQSTGFHQIVRTSSRRNGVKVRLLWQYPFSDWLGETLGTSLCLIGYCMLGKIPYWLVFRLECCEKLDAIRLRYCQIMASNDLNLKLGKANRGRGEVSMEQCWNEDAGGKREIPRKPANQRHRLTLFPHTKILERLQTGIEPGSPRWEASSLTTDVKKWRH